MSRFWSSVARIAPSPLVRRLKHRSVATPRPPPRKRQLRSLSQLPSRTQSHPRSPLRPKLPPTRTQTQRKKLIASKTKTHQPPQSLRWTPTSQMTRPKRCQRPPRAPGASRRRIRSTRVPPSRTHRHPCRPTMMTCPPVRMAPCTIRERTPTVTPSTPLKRTSRSWLLASPRKRSPSTRSWHSLGPRCAPGWWDCVRRLRVSGRLRGLSCCRWRSSAARWRSTLSMLLPLGAAMRCVSRVI
mmetsp:Transcript_30107/g.63812  ORF Transcript_30107/g.63812 Transcript_30107/m.63812 type:complete len:241 (+) Transcript_30107:781-1503(+)